MLYDNADEAGALVSELIQERSGCSQEDSPDLLHIHFGGLVSSCKMELKF